MDGPIISDHHPLDSIDPYGLAADRKNNRIRGARGFLRAMTPESVSNVSLINAMDDGRAGNTSYYAGSSFTTLLTVSLEI